MMVAPHSIETTKGIVDLLHKGHAGELVADPATGTFSGITVIPTPINRSTSPSFSGEMVQVGEVAARATEAYFPDRPGVIENIPDFKLRETTGSQDYAFIRRVIDTNGRKAY